MSGEADKLVVEPWIERRVAGGVATLEECRDEVMRMLRYDDFADAISQAVFIEVQLMLRLGKKVDPPAVWAAMEASGRAKEMDRREFDRICDPTEARGSVLYHAGLVREKGRRRRIAQRVEYWRGRAGEADSEATLTDMAEFAADLLGEPEEEVRISSFSDVLGGLPEVRWLWEGWLARGMLTLLVSAPGEGKSALALEISRRTLLGEWNIAAAKSAGPPSSESAPPMPTNPLEAKEAPKGTVLYVDTEASGAVLRRRVEGWGVPLEGLNVFAACGVPGMAELSLDDARGWGRLYKGVMETRPALVVVDSLSGAHARGENSADIRRLLLKLARLARDSSAAFLVVHHLRKRLGREGIVSVDRVRGSGAISQLARSVWVIERPDPSDRRRRLSQAKNNLVEIPGPVGFTIADSGVSFCEAPSEPRIVTQFERAMDLVRAALRDGPREADDVYALGEASGISRGTVDRASSVLCVIRHKPHPKAGWKWLLPVPAAPARTSTP